MKPLFIKIISLCTVCSLAVFLGTLRNPILANETQATSSSLENIKKIIQDNVQSGAVRGAIDTLFNKKTALLGQVTRVTEETITLTSRHGTRIVPINQTLTITKDDEIIEITDIAVENWVTILGKTQDDAFTPIFLWVNTQSPLPQTQFIDIGTITDITRNTVTLESRANNESKTISVSSNTDYEDINGLTITLDQLSADLTILVSGTITDSKITALTIRSLAPLANTAE